MWDVVCVEGVRGQFGQDGYRLESFASVDCSTEVGTVF